MATPHSCTNGSIYQSNKLQKWSFLLKRENDHKQYNHIETTKQRQTNQKNDNNHSPRIHGKYRYPANSVSHYPFDTTSSALSFTFKVSKPEDDRPKKPTLPNNDCKDI